MISDDLISQAETLVRDLRRAQQSRPYRVTWAGEEDLLLPTNIARPLVEKKILYQCSGCPDWHVNPTNLPEGIAAKGFIKLLRIMSRKSCY